MTGEKQERASMGFGERQCPIPSTNTRCKKRKLETVETQEVVRPEENEPEEGCQDHVKNFLIYSTVYYIHHCAYLNLVLNAVTQSFIANLI